MRVSPIRVLLLASVALAVIGLMVWHKQFPPSSVVHAQTSSTQAIDDARAALDKAVAKEKLNPTKKAALAVDAALQAYNAAVAFRVEEIHVILNELADDIKKHGKTLSTLRQIEALKLEMITLQAVAGPTPTVNPETEPNDTSGTANTIDLSAAAQPCAMVSAAINPGGDLDFFTFTGVPAGSRIWIETDTGGTQNVGATSRDTVIDLLAADGTTVIENDDDDGTGNGGDGTVETGLASMVGGRTLTAGGTYFIKVRAFSGTAIVDPYRLFVVLTNTAATPEVESNDTAATANTTASPIGLNSGSIGVAADVDYYSVAATAGNIVYFNVDADPERDATGTDLVVEFRDPADVLLLSIDSSITGSLANPAAEGANFTISVSGTYFIKVRHFSAVGTGTYHLMVSACSGDPIGGGGCTSITCPANVAGSNDPNQCGAVVTYPPPTTSGTCGTVTCSPASGSFFPVGTTTVTCTSSAGPTCSFTVTVNDTQAPTVACPASITVVGATGSPTVVVTYPPPTASDNCPGVTVACVPPSGSSVPVGTTTVTCTATDASSNTASCSFTVTSFDGRLQDNSAGCSSTVLFNSLTGEYQFCCGGTVYMGTGKVTKKGNIVTVEENSPGRRVLIKLDNSAHAGSASLQSPPGTIKCTISDSNTTNDTCTCP